jgi:hypothetical protein
MHSPLAATEMEIIGQWAQADGGIREDASTKRIHWLLDSCLTFVAVDESGWQKLYVNPADGQYWELSFPQSHWHGGGPPTLTRLDKDVAQRRYRVRQ